jgi:hypothetical protein
VLPTKILGAANRWAARWLNATADVSVRMHEGAGDFSTSGGAFYRRLAPGGPIAALTRAGSIKLGCALIGVEPKWSKMSDADATFLGAIADACADDLLREIAGAFPPIADAPQDARSSSEPDSDAICFAVSAGAAGVFVYASRALAASARRAAAPPARAPRPLAKRDQAIGRQSVTVGAMLGTGKIRLAELASLRAGDVLVLDRACDERLELTIDGELKPAASCELHQEQGGFCLRIGELSPP